MKKISLVFLFSCVALWLAAQSTNEQTLKSDIKSVVAYLSGAEINREVSVNLKKGKNALVFTALSPGVDSKSIRITSHPDVSVLGISTRQSFLSQQQDLPRLKELKDSLSLLKSQMADFNDELSTYNTEKELLLKNMQMNNENKNISVTELQQAADFYRKRILEINRKLSGLTALFDDKSKAVQRVSSELQVYEVAIYHQRTDIIVTLTSPRALTTPVSLQYLVQDAGWSPSYEIKATDVNQPVALAYKAKVYNNTSIEWKNVALVLSTANPDLSVAKPTLNPWYLNYSQPSNYRSDQAMGYTQNRMVESVVFDDESVDGYAGGISTGELTQVEVPELNAEFKIRDTYTIPADNEPYLVDIATHEISAEFKHFAVTKLDRDVFLLAHIAGWQDLNLIEGPANVYYGGTYIGESYVQTRDVKDTLALSLGRDNRVLVTRTKLKDYSDKQLIGNKVTETYTFEMVAKNNRKTAIELDLLDQIPISQTDEIEVKILEISNADHNVNTGQLKWKIALQPGESRKITLSFSIKYPKNKPITVKKTQARYMRKF